ncbi:hypothetical protein QF117_10590 [Vibrio sp. YMD68]|uniref:hypothetical protein n=1 Tax=Vibrio sp. YMD68 TaxID=3042300 RepID=UPI00249ABEC1|nr:hypothetical protein [Vibrio sp. YMD68]WGV98836.1 hypothetical protein QF117_02420 [Vibrio sp. YMD68]WGW01237.1 hypothetical protein QF117_10590 [Vibrio sp. YMD68]
MNAKYIKHKFNVSEQKINLILSLLDHDERHALCLHLVLEQMKDTYRKLGGTKKLGKGHIKYCFALPKSQHLEKADFVVFVQTREKDLEI